MKQFKADLVFQNFSDAKVAEAELRAAGFATEITDEVDIHSSAVFMNVSHAGALDLFERVCDIIDPFDGLCAEFGVE